LKAKIELQSNELRKSIENCETQKRAANTAWGCRKIACKG